MGATCLQSYILYFESGLIDMNIILPCYLVDHQIVSESLTQINSDRLRWIWLKMFNCQSDEETSQSSQSMQFNVESPPLLSHFHPHQEI